MPKHTHTMRFPKPPSVETQRAWQNLTLACADCYKTYASALVQFADALTGLKTAYPNLEKACTPHINEMIQRAALFQSYNKDIRARQHLATNLFADDFIRHGLEQFQAVQDGLMLHIASDKKTYDEMIVAARTELVERDKKLPYEPRNLFAQQSDKALTAIEESIKTLNDVSVNLTETMLEIPNASTHMHLARKNTPQTSAVASAIKLRELCASHFENCGKELGDYLEAFNQSLRDYPTLRNNDNAPIIESITNEITTYTTLASQYRSHLDRYKDDPATFVQQALKLYETALNDTGAFMAEHIKNVQQAIEDIHEVCEQYPALNKDGMNSFIATSSSHNVNIEKQQGEFKDKATGLLYSIAHSDMSQGTEDRSR